MEDGANNEVTDSENENEDTLFNTISAQMHFLTDKFKVFETLGEIDKQEDESENKNEIDTLHMNPSENKKIQSLIAKLKEKDNLLYQIREEYSEAEREYTKTLNEKDLIIDNIKRELDLMKSERNESINQMQNIFKEIGVNSEKNKFAIFNMRKGGAHSHQNSLTSLSSLSTYHDDKSLEKLNNEKTQLEKQLVECKYKYAETSAKLNELEGEFDKLRKKCDDNTDKIKLKDNLLKKIAEERDHYKFRTNPHYSVNSCEYKPPNINPKKVETVQMNTEGEVKIVDDYLKFNTSNNSKNKMESPNIEEPVSNSSSQSGSLIKYFKNIFKSGK